MKLATYIFVAVSATAAKQVAGQEPELGDQVRLFRYKNGVPILAHDQHPSTCTETSGSGCCLWPLASSDCPEDCKEGKNEVYQYEYEDGISVSVINETRIGVYSCAIDEECASCVVETDFGRTSVVRSPDYVLDDQFDEVFKSLALSVCKPALDPAGRLVYFYPGKEEGVGEAFTIDSPLQNLAIYRALLREKILFINEIGESVPIPQGASALKAAARALGAAFDKGREVTVDLVAYTNKILGLLNETSWLDKLCIYVRDEMLGELNVTEQCFLDFSSFGYVRRNNFEYLPQPPYIPAEEPQNGTFEYLSVVELNPGQESQDGPIFEITQEPIMDATGVFADVLPEGLKLNDTGAFVKAADDARAVINFMHNWPVPTAFATNWTCAASNDTDAYNVYIKELQVPKNMIKDASDRYFTVNVEISTWVGNAKNLWLNVKGVNGDIVFAKRSANFTLGPRTASYSHSYMDLIHADLTGASGTIIWTATIENVGNDYNTADNVKTATSEVIDSGSGTSGTSGNSGNPKKNGKLLRGL